MHWDTLTFINLVLSIIILAFGLISWQRSNSRVTLYVGIAFGLFGLSHLGILLGIASTNIALIIDRILAYLLVAYALFLEAYKK